MTHAPAVLDRQYDQISQNVVNSKFYQHFKKIHPDLAAQIDKSIESIQTSVESAAFKTLPAPTKVITTTTVPLPEVAHPTEPLKAAKEALQQALLEVHLTPADRRVYTLLYALACDDHQLRGFPWSAKLREVTVFCIQDVLADACEVSVRTVRRAIRKLEAAGLIASQPHHVTLAGRCVSEGTLFTLLVHPEHRHRGPRLHVRRESHKVTLQDSQHEIITQTNRTYRNLEEDMASGRTAYLQVVRPQKMLRQARKNKQLEDPAAPCPIQHPYQESQGFKRLKDFLNMIVIERKQRTTVTVTRTENIFVFRDLLRLTRKQLREQIKTRAEQLALTLQDTHVQCWMKLLWQYVKAFWEGRDHTTVLQQAYHQTLRAGGFVRNPGAYLLHQLQQNTPETLSELLPL